MQDYHALLAGVLYLRIRYSIDFVIGAVKEVFLSAFVTFSISLMQRKNSFPNMVVPFIIKYLMYL